MNWVIVVKREPHGEEFTYGPFSTRETAERVAVALAGNPAIMALTISPPESGEPDARERSSPTTTSTGIRDQIKRKQSQ